MTRAIEISVHNRIAKQYNKTEYICGNRDFAVEFIFDSEWAEVENKTARFIFDGQYIDVEFSGNVCPVPFMLDVSSFKVGVYAENLRTTTSAEVRCKKSVLCEPVVRYDPESEIDQYVNKEGNAVSVVDTDSEMRKIKISVSDRIAWRTNRTEYICGNGDYVIEFAFDGEWRDAEHKTARFINGGKYADVLFAGNICPVPVTFKAKSLMVGVYAGNLKTTTSAEVRCKESILCEAGTPEVATPDVYSQIITRLDDIERNAISDERLSTAIEDYFEENPIDTGVDFETDSTLTLKDGILSVNTTNEMEEDNTLPITSAGVFATVGNIEVLLKTI